METWITPALLVGLAALTVGMIRSLRSDMNRRIDELRSDMDRRMGELRSDLGGRLDKVERGIERL